MARFMDFIFIFAMHSLITRLLLNTFGAIDFKCNMYVNDNHFSYFGIKIVSVYGKIFLKMALIYYFIQNRICIFN